jgi:hypothetical protein
VFTVGFLVVGVGLFGSIWVFRNRARRGKRLTYGCLPFTVVFGVLTAFLLTKLVYEEPNPCVAVDATSCEFDSTRYRHPFKWKL